MSDLIVDSERYASFQPELSYDTVKSYKEKKKQHFILLETPKQIK